jgi:hypothetical protein
MDTVNLMRLIPYNLAIVQDIFTRLWNNGFIEERETIQPYCPKHEYAIQPPPSPNLRYFTLSLVSACLTL